MRIVLFCTVVVFHIELPNNEGGDREALAPILKVVRKCVTQAMVTQSKRCLYVLKQPIHNIHSRYSSASTMAPQESILVSESEENTTCSRNVHAKFYSRSKVPESRMLLEMHDIAINRSSGRTSWHYLNRGLNRISLVYARLFQLIHFRKTQLLESYSRIRQK
jgi:hypothetical protein